MTIQEKVQHLREQLQIYLDADAVMLNATRNQAGWSPDHCQAWWEKAVENRRVALLSLAGAARVMLPCVLDQVDQLETEREEIRRAAIREFYDAVMVRADETMRQTNRVEGAHYNALKSEFEKEFQPK